MQGVQCLSSSDAQVIFSMSSGMYCNVTPVIASSMQCSRTGQSSLSLTYLEVIDQKQTRVRFRMSRFQNRLIRELDCQLCCGNLMVCLGVKSRLKTAGQASQLRSLAASSVNRISTMLQSQLFRMSCICTADQLEGLCCIL